MQQDSTLPPGTRIRDARGLIGMVERIQPGMGGPYGQGPTAIVRSTDQRFRYAIPVALISGVNEVNGERLAQIAIDDTDLNRYLMPEPTEGSQSNVPLNAKPPPAATINTLQRDTLTVPLAEEQIVASTQPIELGTLHLRKAVETMPQRVAVNLTHEQASIERVPADQFDAKLRDDPNLMVIPIIEERLVVQVQPVVTEYILIHKDRLTETQEIQGTVRRETLTVTQDATPDSPPLFRVAGLDEQPAQG